MTNPTITRPAALLLLATLCGCDGELPIMTCDPATLRKGMPKAEVIEVCGEPADQSRETWYPLSGDKRDEKVVLVYGSILSHTHNVNLYMRGGVLDSVQIYGDYK
jgi:Protein of unknown function (DUF2845)